MRCFAIPAIADLFDRFGEEFLNLRSLFGEFQFEHPVAVPASTSRSLCPWALCTSISGTISSLCKKCLNANGFVARLL